MASLNAMRGPAIPSNAREHERKVNRSRGSARPTDSDRALWLMIMLTSPTKIESSMRLALHHGRRKHAHRIQARLFPKNFPRNRQQRILRIASAANSISIFVAGPLNRLYDNRIETSVRISEMPNRNIQFRFDDSL